MYAVIGFWVAFFCTVKSWFSFSNANNSGFSLTVWCPITVYILALNPLILDIRIWHSVELHPSPDSKENTSRVCTTQTDRFALHISQSWAFEAHHSKPSALWTKFCCIQKPWESRGEDKSYWQKQTQSLSKHNSSYQTYRNSSALQQSH